MTSFYNLLKYAATGIASPDMTYYDKMRASTLMGGVVQTLTGIPPLTFKADGSPLISLSMKGNGQQTGTPTPDNPVMPEFVGVRTGNLFDYVAYFGSTFIPYNEYFNYAEINLHPNTTYTLSTSFREYGTNPRNTAFIVATTNQTPTTMAGGLSSKSPVTITTESDGKIRLYKRISGATEQLYPTKELFDNGSWLMLNLGSTALPYEPYGWAEKITCAGQTTPIYLGQTQTVRKIRKLVLTGEENIQYNAQNKLFYFALSDVGINDLNALLCSHFQKLSDNQNLGAIMTNSGAQIRIYDLNLTWQSAADFKQFLRDEYSDGHPVTVWYALAEPQTGIVNEPLAKIGDYADELHSTDAGVSIPTVKGSNTLTIETELQPSEMSITYRG